MDNIFCPWELSTEQTFPRRPSDGLPSTGWGLRGQLMFPILRSMEIAEDIQRFALNPEDNDMPITTGAALDREIAQRRVGLDHPAGIGHLGELSGFRPQEIDVARGVEFSPDGRIPVPDFLKVAAAVGREAED